MPTEFLFSSVIAIFVAFLASLGACEVLNYCLLKVIYEVKLLLMTRYLFFLNKVFVEFLFCTSFKLQHIALMAHIHP